MSPFLGNVPISNQLDQRQVSFIISQLLGLETEALGFFRAFSQATYEV